MKLRSIKNKIIDEYFTFARDSKIYMNNVDFKYVFINTSNYDDILFTNLICWKKYDAIKDVIEHQQQVIAEIDLQIKTIFQKTNI